MTAKAVRPSVPLLQEQHLLLILLLVRLLRLLRSPLFLTQRPQLVD